MPIEMVPVGLLSPDLKLLKDTNDTGKYLGSVEILSSFDPIVKDSVSNDKEYIAVYMKKEFLPLAIQLQDASKNPIIENFVFVSSTDKHITDTV